MPQRVLHPVRRWGQWFGRCGRWSDSGQQGSGQFRRRWANRVQCRGRAGELRKLQSVEGFAVLCETGVFATGVTDLGVTAAGWSLVASRAYNSAQVSSGLTGPGWVSNVGTKLSYSVYLYAAPNTYQKEADIRMPDGRVLPTPRMPMV